jgi:hypothetical protein
MAKFEHILLIGFANILIFVGNAGSHLKRKGNLHESSPSWQIRYYFLAGFIGVTFHGPEGNRDLRLVVARMSVR